MSGCGQKWAWSFSHETLRLKNEFMKWADFLHADCDAINFG